MHLSDEILSAYREFLPKLSRNATGFFCWHTVPPAPPFPEEIHMRKVCGIVWCIVGSDEDAERAMSPNATRTRHARKKYSAGRRHTLSRTCAAIRGAGKA